mgnify:CR=1 FL=1
MRKILTALLVFLSPLSFAQEKVSLADISLKTLDNQTVTLSQYQDKPLYIKMWASWCPICLAGLAEIDDLSAEKNLDFNVITIASPGQKNEQNSSKFINWYKGLDYKNITVLLDENGEIIAKGEISLDLTGRKAGRGAYVCRNLACFEKARKARRFERSLSCKIPDEVYEQMQSEFAAADSK